MTIFRPLTPDEFADIHDMLKRANKESHGSDELVFTALEALEEAIIPDPQPEPEPEPRRGLIAYIYKNGTDASNGGISSRHDEVVLVGPGIPEIFAESESMPAVEIGTISFAGNTTYHLRPAGEPRKHYMFGGTFVHSTDSRFRKMFPFNGAVALHDRHEG